MKHYEYSIQILHCIVLYWYAAAIVLVLKRQQSLIDFSQELVVYKQVPILTAATHIHRGQHRPLCLH